MAEEEMMFHIKGIVHIMGEPDVGKTTFANEGFPDPSKAWFIDDDVKGRTLVDRLAADGVKFGRYINLTSMLSGKTEPDIYKAVMEIVDSIPKDGLDAIVWDTWATPAAGFHHEVVTHMSKYRSDWSPKGDIKGAQQWQSTRMLERQIIAKMREKVPALFFVSHLTDQYVNSVKIPGLKKPAAGNVLEQVSDLRLWLLRNPSGAGVPMALVLKRIAKQTFVPGVGIRTVQVLPQRIVPQEGDRSLWDAIQRYWHEPVGNRKPTADEVPNEYEFGIIRGTVTPDQTRMFQLLIAAGVKDSSVDLEIAEGGEPITATRDAAYKVRIDEAKEKGIVAPAAIAKETGIPMPDVVRLLA